MTEPEAPRYTRFMTSNRRIGPGLVTAIIGAATVLHAAPARAQFHASDDRVDLITSTTTTSSAVAVGITILAIVAVDKEPRTALEHYLRDNEIAVRAALAAGAGSAIGDLAAFFAIREEDLPVFARLLRREREALSLHAFRTRDVDAFVRHIAAAIGLEPTLRPS